MPRQARVVIPGAPHHVIQRGNRRQTTFFSDADYLAYIKIAAEEFDEAGVEVWSYCLMPNHVHLIALPREPASLALAVGSTHLRYTRRINRREAWAGFLWQGRFSSFPMDNGHLVTCARYIGLNPVRAGLVERADDWRWSSVAAHLHGRPDPLLRPEPLRDMLLQQMAGFYDTDVDEEALRRFRRASATGRPLGAASWVRQLENSTGLTLTARPVGRPKSGTRTISGNVAAAGD